MKKRIITLLIITGLFSSLQAQEDSLLTKKLNTFIRATQQLDFSTVIDLTYPKIFEFVPREVLEDRMNEEINNEDFFATMDSVAVTHISPSVKNENGEYKLITYFSITRLKYHEPFDSTDTEYINLLMEIIKTSYPEASIDFSINTINISSLSKMFAIKDSDSPEWSFIAYEDDLTLEMIREFIGSDTVDQLLLLDKQEPVLEKTK